MKRDERKPAVNHRDIPRWTLPGRLPRGLDWAYISRSVLRHSYQLDGGLEMRFVDNKR